MVRHRIAFVGASGTGKSTLAVFLAGALKLPINPVGSRSVAEAMGYASPYDVDKAGRRAEFQRRLILDKVAWEAAHEEFVVDRTTIDNVAYTVMHDVAAVDEELFAHMFVGMWRYTTIVYCPLKVFCNLSDDPVRVKSTQYQEVFDVLIEGLLRRYARQGYYTMRSSRLEDRKVEVLKYIGE